jgi:hypothetical protein
VSKSSVRHGDIRPFSQWVSQSSVRHGESRPLSLWTCSLGWWSNFTMSYKRLAHWDDGRISPCLTQDLLTGAMDEYHHVLQKTLTGSIVPVRKSSVRHGDIRPLSQWVSQSSVRHGESRPLSLWESSVRHGDIRPSKNVTMSYWRLTHWDDGRMSPCLTEDCLTGMMVECHHVLQKTFSLWRWKNVTYHPSEQVLCKTWWHSSIVPVSKSSVRHGEIRPSSQWVSQPSVRHGWNSSIVPWTNVTMSYRRLTHWDDGRMSPCLT